MSSSEEETSLIKTPQRQAADEGHSSSEKAKAERLRKQRELQAAFKERMRVRESQKGKEEASQSVLENPPQEQSSVRSRSYFLSNY